MVITRSAAPTNVGTKDNLKPITLVSPRDNNRNAVIVPYLANPGAAYYALTEADITFPVLSGHVIEALTAQGYATGRGNVGETDQDAGRALGKALTKAGVEILVLDEYDHIPVDPSEWITGLVGSLTAASHVVINARELNYSVWSALIGRGTAEVAGGQEGVPKADDADQRMEVYALGQGAVWYEGRVVSRWDGPLTRRLFYFLLDHGPVSRLAIFEAFWPNLPIREATNVFHVTKRKMNETIGCDATDYSDRHYMINEQVRLHYDVADFEGALREADAAQGDESVSAWERAIHLYRHPFLFEEKTAWIVERRKILREGYAGALIGLARIFQHRKDNDQALMFFMRAINEAPLREDLYLQVMRLYAERGEKKAALAQYENLNRRLSTQLGIAPAREIATLAAKLNR